jgi:hypothetical protein
MENILVFSIALNGYQWRYRKYLASHLRYAEKFNYHYQVVTRPTFSSLGTECCWLKLTLMQAALETGYQYVVFLDADAFVQTSCPEITTITRNDKYLYMAKGYSNRFNSGVMIVKNHRKLRQWLTLLIANQNKAVRIENDVGWGENGHVIEFSHNCDFVQELPQAWNNTYSTALADFIRHQNCGPLRSNFFDNLFHKILFSLASRATSLAKRLTTVFKANPQEKSPQAMLANETARVLAHYPCFLVLTTTTSVSKQTKLKG